MIDAHIHLESEEYDNDRDEVIARFFESGGRAIVNVGVDEQRMKKSMEIAKLDKRIFVAVGFHPQEVTDLFSANKKVTFEKILEDFVQSPKVVAIGEIGLDYFHPSATNYELKIDEEIKKIQKELFIRQLNLAKKLKLPVIIHSWDAENDCWEILKSYPDLKTVFHCYGRGINPDFTEMLLEHKNIYFSFTGNVTFPKSDRAGSEIFEHLNIIPLERMMVETDGPFLSPVPHRGKRNEPAFVKLVIKQIAEVKGMSTEKVETVTDQNAIEFFNLPI